MNTRSVSARFSRTSLRAGYRRSAHTLGFTLVELMVVVIITGILAALGFASLRAYVTSASATEALNMVQSIRAAQERYRSEYMVYLNVSASGESWFPQDPTVSEHRGTQMPFFYDPSSGVHSDNTQWLRLRPTAPNAVRFGYMVNAGPAGAAMTAAMRGPAITWPTPTDNWYVIQAIGDTDADGHISYYRASSLSGEVYSIDHGE